MTQPGEDLHELDVPRFDPDRRDPEAPDADAFEQSVPVAPVRVDERPRVRFDVSEAAALEQSQVVELDDDASR